MDIQSYELANLTLWDSPGLGDGGEADKRHIEKIVSKLRETNAKGQLLIDLVLVIVDGSSKDLGTAFTLINDVIIPNIGENHEKRILIAINKADAAQSGHNWNFEQHKPMPKLIDFLDKKAEDIRERIKKSTGVDVEVIYYSAGYKEEDEPQEPSYNLLKLLLYIVRFTPDNKRLMLMHNINTKDEEARFNVNDKPQKELIREIAKEVSRGDIFKKCFSIASKKGAEIGSSVLGLPGKLGGAIVGSIVGSIWGAGKAVFGRKKK